MIKDTTTEAAMSTEEITNILTTSEREDVMAMREELAQLAPTNDAIVEATDGTKISLTQHGRPLTAAAAISAIRRHYVRVTRRQVESIEINGEDAQVPAGAVAYKYADPTEDARWIENADEARKIEREDANLIVWVPIDITVSDRTVSDSEINAVAEGTRCHLATILVEDDGTRVQMEGVQEFDADTPPTEAEVIEMATELLRGENALDD